MLGGRDELRRGQVRASRTQCGKDVVVVLVGLANYIPLLAADFFQFLRQI